MLNPWLICISFFIVGMLVGFVAGSFKEKESTPVVGEPCPHGYDDWGDCPDCCH